MSDWVAVDVNTRDRDGNRIHIIAVEICGPSYDRGPHVRGVLIQRDTDQLEVVSYRTAVLGLEE